MIESKQGKLSFPTPMPGDDEFFRFASRHFPHHYLRLFRYDNSPVYALMAAFWSPQELINAEWCHTKPRHQTWKSSTRLAFGYKDGGLLPIYECQGMTIDKAAEQCPVVADDGACMLFVAEPKFGHHYIDQRLCYLDIAAMHHPEKPEWMDASERYQEWSFGVLSPQQYAEMKRLAESSPYNPDVNPGIITRPPGITGAM